MRGSWLTFTAAVVAITVTACGGTAGSDTSPARTPDRTVFCNAAYEYGRRTQVQDDPAVTQELWNEQAEYIKTANGSVPDDLADDWALVLTAGETSRTNLANNQWNLIPGDPAPDEAFLAASKRLQGVCTEVVLDFQRH